MLGDAAVTFTGNLAGDPELRFTASGTAVANFSVAVTGREKNPAGAWVDGHVTFLRCTVWRDLADHVAASLSKGDRVSVQGTLSSRDYVTKDGDKRQSWEVEAEDVAVSLRFADVRVSRATREPVATAVPA